MSRCRIWGLIEAANLATITIDLKGDSTNAGVIEGFNGGVITLNGNGHGFTNQILIEAFGEGTQIQLSEYHAVESGDDRG